MANRNKKISKKTKTKFARADKFKEELLDDKDKLMSNKGKASAEIKGQKGYNNKASNYIPDEKLRSQIGHFSFNTTIGLPDTLHIEEADASTNGTSVIGNILVFRHFTNIGILPEGIGTDNPRTGLNAAALKLYNTYSADNGKTTKYLPEDIAMAIIMVGEIVSAIAHFQRAYGVAFTLNYRNRTYPKAILKAMGFDPDDFMTHLSDARLKFNALISRASNIRMPYNIGWFEHCWELYSHIFYDKGSAMGQYYINRPYGFFKYYEEYTGPDERQLVEARFEVLNDNIGVLNYLLYLEDMIDKCLASSLFNYVFTDVVRNSQRAGTELLGFNYLDEIYTITPEFSETYMTQMHNASWGMFDLTDYKISDSPETLEILSNLRVIGKATDRYHTKAVGGDQILDFPYTDAPDTDLVIDALAYKCVVDLYQPEGASANEFILRAVPPHPIYDVKVQTLATIGSTGSYDDRFLDVPFGMSGTEMSEAWNQFALFALDSIDVRPIRYVSLSDTWPKNVFGPLNYWTSVSQKQLSRVFEYYFLGLFDAFFPSTGRLT